MTQSLTFDAVDEAAPGPKWAARWARSWPAYESWFVGRGGDTGPSRADCEAALARYMPELVPIHRRLTQIAGGTDRAARFLSTWCPPHYLGGCSLAAMAQGDCVRLVRNYDLSPDLNEGLLLRSDWSRTCRAGQGAGAMMGPVMGMVEFLWGVSDGINGAGLSVALAYGGRQAVGRGFGITTILRYVLETCGTTAQALAALARVPSHMAYNVVLADAGGATASVELYAGGGVRVRPVAFATNHQHDGSQPDRALFTRTRDRARHLESLFSAGAAVPQGLAPAFLAAPLRQDRFDAGFGTLFTAEYDPVRRGLTLHWPGDRWAQSLDDFAEGQRTVIYAGQTAPQAAGPAETWADHDWAAIEWHRVAWDEIDYGSLAAAFAHGADAMQRALGLRQPAPSASPDAIAATAAH